MIEVLIATMHKNSEEDIIKLVKKMNIQSDAIVINQNENWVEKKEIFFENKRITYICTKEKGLSRSRNLALKYATKEIVIIADDDVIYEEGYTKLIEQEYQKNKKADAIAFFVELEEYPKDINFIRSNKAINKIESMKLCSVYLTFKLSAIKNQRFDERFGAGSRYTMGEESIFLFDLLEKNKKMFYCPKKIAYAELGESTWFNGFNKKYFFDKGAAYQRMFGNMSFFMSLQFILRKKDLFNQSILSSYLCMVNGIKDVKQKEI